MRKFQIDPAGPPVRREAPPPPPPPVAAPAPPPPPPPREAPRGRARVWLVVLAALAVVAAGTVGGMWALDVGPFAYPERYLLTEGEVPPGLRMQALPPPVRSELGIDENPDRVPDEKLDEFSDTPARQAWLQSLGTGRPGEQLVIAAILYADADAAEEGARVSYCEDASGGDGVTMRDGKVVVVVTAFTEAAASRIPVVEAALREKADGLTVACRW